MSITSAKVLDSADVAPGSGGRIVSLDGMRGIAVLAVMLFHTASMPLAGGYLGVDVFFVLSGFLIGGILLDQHQRSGHVVLGSFWLRRARRLAPPLLVLLLVLAVVRLVTIQPDAGTWRADILAALTYTTNWFQIISGGDYFAQFGVESPLVHTWSLAIEEQFYLGFALLMALLLPRLSRAAVAALITVMALASAVLMVLASADVTWTYYSTFTRIQALLIGVLLSMVVRRDQRWWQPARSRTRTAIGVVAGLGIAVLFVAPDQQDFMFRGGYTLVALLTAAVIWAVLAPGALTSMLAWRPLVALGVISYGVYLWHWPIFQWLGTRRDAGIDEQVVAIVLTILVSVASYCLIERPIRQGRFTRWRQWRQWIAYAAVAVVVAGLSLLPARTPPPSTELVWPAADQIPRTMFGAGDSSMLALGVPFPQSRYPETLLWGPVEMGCGIVDEPYMMQGVETPTQERCLTWRSIWRERFAENDAQVSIISSWVWDAYDRSVDGVARPPGTPEFDDSYTAAFTQAATIASDNGRIPVYILGVPCMAAEQSYHLVLNDPARIQRLNNLLRTVVAQVPNARFVDMAPLTCNPDGSGVRFRNGQELRDDGVHWTPAGAEQVWAMLLARMVADGVPGTRPAPTMTP